MNRETEQEQIDIIKAMLSSKEQEYLIKDSKPKLNISTQNNNHMVNIDEFYIGNKFLHDKFGDYIIDHNNIVKINGKLHIYKDGIYLPDDKEILGAMINIISNLTTHKRNEVYNYIDIKCKKEKELSPPHLIPFKTNIYDLKMDKYLDYSPNYVFLNKFPFDYIKNSPIQSSITTLINQIANFDQEVIKLLYETIGYCFYRDCPYRGAVILYGASGNNGKSTLLNLIKKLIGYKNISNLSIQDTSDKFRISELYGKCANIGDDIPSNYIGDSSLFKKLVTGETVVAERKYKDPFTFNNYAKLFFASNDLPRINDKTKAFISRIIIIPLNHDFKNDKNYNPNMKDRSWSQQEMEYLTVLAMEGLKRLIKNNSFTYSKAVIEELQEYEQVNNPTITFLTEYGEIENKYTEEVYKAYTIWCLDNGYKATTKKTLSVDIKKHLGLVTKNTRVNKEQKKRYVKQLIPYIKE